MNQISSNADGESGRGSTGDDSGLLDRRAYLRLTGATVAGVAATSAGSGAVSAASVETIEVSSGEEERIELDGGDTLENTIIDVSARGASVAIRARTRGGDIAIRNVAIEGVDTQADDTINVAAYDEDATVTIENCYFGDGGEDDAGDGAGEGEGCIFVNASHAGDLLIRNVHVANFETGIYASAPGNPPVESKPDKQVGEGGTVRIEDTYLANVEKSGYKLGSTGSYVENSIAKDAGNPVFVVWNEIDARDVDIRNRGEEAFNVGYKFDPAGEEAVAVIEDCRAEAERYVVGPGSARGEVDPNPDLSPPDGVPMSPEEAASGEDGSDGGGGDGGSGDDGGSDGGDDGSGDDGGDGGSDLPNRLRVQATGDLTTYEFTVSGDLEAGPEFDTDGTDVISGSTGRGRVNTTGSDDFYFGGEITRFERDGELEVYVDGERVDPDSFLPRELRVSNREYDEPATYEFSISEDLAATDSVNTTDGDEINGRSADGRVNGGADTYRFAGEIDSFAYDGPLDLYVDGEQADPDGFGSSEPARSLSIVSEGPRVEYEFAVSGALEKTTARNGSINDNDEIDGSSASGLVYGGTDSYAFDGELTDLVVDDPAGVTVFLDGEEIEPDSPGLDRTVSIVGTGPRVEYDFTVSGELEKSTARGGSINSGDEVSGSSASGYVLGGTDSYGFDGEISDFAIDDADAATVYVDGEEVDLGGIGDSDSHELTISNRAYDEPATYEFTVSGALDATSSVNPNDEISGSSAQGQVNGGADTYRYSGDVTAFDSDGPLDVTIDGETVLSGG